MLLSRSPGRWPGRAACQAALAVFAMSAAAAGAQPAPAPAAAASAAPGGRPATPGPIPAFPAEPAAFREYRPFADAPPADWRGANDTVGRIGGWRAYAREAQAPVDPKPNDSGAAHHGGHR